MAIWAHHPRRLVPRCTGHTQKSRLYTTLHTITHIDNNGIAGVFARHGHTSTMSPGDQPKMTSMHAECRDDAPRSAPFVRLDITPRRHDITAVHENTPLASQDHASAQPRACSCITNHSHAHKNARSCTAKHGMCPRDARRSSTMHPLRTTREANDPYVLCTPYLPMLLRVRRAVLARGMRSSRRTQAVASRRSPLIPGPGRSFPPGGAPR